jgi:predicted nucleic acid-binding protein
LIRHRKNESESEKKLRRRLLKEKNKGVQFTDHYLDIEDLQEVAILENRKNLGKGELSSIIFAKKTRQAFMTDDKGARNLAESVIDNSMIQTTPHLLGWLFYSNILADSDKKDIIEEHSEFRSTQWGNLSKFFDIMYIRALKYRLMHRDN